MDLFVVVLVLLVCFLVYSVKKPSPTTNDTSSHSVAPAVLPKEPVRVEGESALRQRSVKGTDYSTQSTQPKEPQAVDEEDTKKMDTVEEASALSVEHISTNGELDGTTQNHAKEEAEEKEDVPDETTTSDNDSEGFESDESEDVDGTDLTEVTNSTAFNTHIAACASLQGMRPNNEDRFVIAEIASSSVLAVFDGHDGPAASEYCAKHLTRAVQASKKYPVDIPAALTDAFLLLDRKFLDKGQDGGSTAVVALVADGVVHVASAGDSRCVAGIAGKAVALSVDHKPDLPLEKERIEAANHEVQQKVEVVQGKRTKVARVDGKLAVSRAIGDSDFKDDPSATASEQAVTAKPDVQTVTITPDMTFMVLACDGLFDVMSNQDVVDFIEQRLDSVDGVDQLVVLTKDLVSHAITTLGSGDNVTVVLVKF